MLKSLISKGLSVPHRCENRYIAVFCCIDHLNWGWLNITRSLTRKGFWDFFSQKSPRNKR